MRIIISLIFQPIGKGNIDRNKRRHDPNGHDYGRHYVHVDGHISFHVLDPGTVEDEKFIISVSNSAVSLWRDPAIIPLTSGWRPQNVSL